MTCILDVHFFKVVSVLDYVQINNSNLMHKLFKSLLYTQLDLLKRNEFPLKISLPYKMFSLTLLWHLAVLACYLHSKFGLKTRIVLKIKKLSEWFSNFGVFGLLYPTYLTCLLIFHLFCRSCVWANIELLLPGAGWGTTDSTQRHLSTPL